MIEMVKKSDILTLITKYAYSFRKAKSWEDIYSMLDMNIQTIDAELVKHGRWVAFNVIDIKDCSSKIRYMCNKCGRYEDEQEPYCNCGAKMDEE